MATTYEWGIETVNDDEIIDHDFRDKLSEYGIDDLIHAINEDQISARGSYTRLVLVRDSDKDGRSWAYLVDGKMPDQFLDAYDKSVCAVPKRFVEEFNA